MEFKKNLCINILYKKIVNTDSVVLIYTNISFKENIFVYKFNKHNNKELCTPLTIYIYLFNKPKTFPMIY